MFPPSLAVDGGHCLIFFALSLPHIMRGIYCSFVQNLCGLLLSPLLYCGCYLFPCSLLLTPLLYHNYYLFPHGLLLTPLLFTLCNLLGSLLTKPCQLFLLAYDSCSKLWSSSPAHALCWPQNSLVVRHTMSFFYAPHMKPLMPVKRPL